MFGASIDWTNLLGLVTICLTSAGVVKAYLIQQERNQKREHEQELMKVRLWTDRDIKTAQIETAAYTQGFELPDSEQDISSQIMQFAASNPEIVQKFMQNLKKE